MNENSVKASSAHLFRTHKFLSLQIMNLQLTQYLKKFCGLLYTSLPADENV